MKKFIAGLALAVAPLFAFPAHAQTVVKPSPVFEVTEVTKDRLEAGSRKSCVQFDRMQSCVKGTSDGVNYLLLCPEPKFGYGNCPIPQVGKRYAVSMAGQKVCFDSDPTHCYAIEIATKNEIPSLEPVPPVSITVTQ